MKTRRIEKMEDLADLLIARGLVVSSREDLLGVLKIVGYYRLTGFLYPYRANDGTENFRVKELLADYPEVPLSAMGFPVDWQTFALWK